MATWNSDGSQASVNSILANNAQAGDTITIPAGTFSWSATTTINIPITLQGVDPGAWGNPTPKASFSTQIQNNTLGAHMLQCTAPNNGHITVKWISFTQISSNNTGSSFCLALDRSDWNGTALVASAYTCLVHDCFFDGGSVQNYMVYMQANGIIVWHCSMVGNCGYQTEMPKYGVSASWNTADTYGTNDTTGLGNCYIEDCYTGPNVASGVGPGYTIDLSDSARVVFRNSKFQDASLGSHGQESSPTGGRLFEIYNNTFLATAGNPSSLQCWFSMRGGTGVFWGNSIQPIEFKSVLQFIVFSSETSQQIPLQTSWPAARQVGQGWSASSSNTYGHPVVPQDGIGQVTTGTFIWNNTGTIPSVANTDVQAANSTFVNNGVDYFMDTAKPGYTPYTYPHPLRTASSSIIRPAPSAGSLSIAIITGKFRLRKSATPVTISTTSSITRKVIRPLMQYA